MKQPVKELFSLSTNDTPSTEDRLSISLSDNHLSYAVSNAAGDRLYALKWFSLAELTAETIGELHQQHPVFAQSYRHVQIGYLQSQTLLTPSADLSTDKAAELLALIHGQSSTDIVLDEAVTTDIRQVYAVPKAVHEWLREHFPQASFHHGYAPLISHISNAPEDGLLVVDFRNEEWSVVAGVSGQLRLAQTFPYHTPADVLFYLLKICQELGLKQDTVQLQLSGLVAERSALYTELLQYFRNVSFREASWGSIDNGDTPAHFFTSLNELSLCGS